MFDIAYSLVADIEAKREVSVCTVADVDCGAQFVVGGCTLLLLTKTVRNKGWLGVRASFIATLKEMTSCIGFACVLV